MTRHVLGQRWFHKGTSPSSSSSSSSHLARPFFFLLFFLPLLDCLHRFLPCLCARRPALRLPPRLRCTPIPNHRPAPNGAPPAHTQRSGAAGQLAGHRSRRGKRERRMHQRGEGGTAASEGGDKSGDTMMAPLVERTITLQTKRREFD